MERLALDFILLVTFLGISALSGWRRGRLLLAHPAGQRPRIEPEDSPGPCAPRPGAPRPARPPDHAARRHHPGQHRGLGARGPGRHDPIRAAGHRHRDPVMVFLIVVVGEVLPMTIAVSKPHGFGLSWRAPCSRSGGSSPPSGSCWAPSRAWSRQAADGEGVAKTAISEAEPRTLVEVGHQEGVVQRKRARDDPRGLRAGRDYGGRAHGSPGPMSSATSTWRRRPTGCCRPSGRTSTTRIPVYEGSLDHVLRILLVKELLPILRRAAARLRHSGRISRPRTSCHQSKRADALLREFKVKKLGWRSSWTSTAGRRG